MSEQPIRTPRQVAIADHLWETFSQMAFQMGVDRDSLVNQALFIFARQSGYLGRPVESSPPPAPVSTAPSFPPIAAPAPTVPLIPPISVQVPMPVVPAREEFSGHDVPPQPMSDHGIPRLALSSVPPVAPAAAAHALPTPVPPVSPSATTPIPPVAPQASPKIPTPVPPLAVPPPVIGSSSTPNLGTRMSPEEARAAQERVLQKADELARLVQAEGGDITSTKGTADKATRADAPPAGPVLVLYAEGREVERVTRPRFLIGRGKHCDLIIGSGKVSREHAAIVREGGEYFIEDLGSSNGTWFEKKRITRRRIEDGDEYFVCAEKLTCRLE